MNTGFTRCPECKRLVPTYDFRLAFHWTVPDSLFGHPVAATSFGCSGGGTTDLEGLAASERAEASRLEREQALAAWAAGDKEPLTRLDLWEAHVREGGD